MSVSGGSSPVLVRPAKAGHRGFIRDLSEEVFSRFGDYRTILAQLFDRKEVRTVVAEVDRRAIGFAMYAIEDGRVILADLVAIAVAPAWQRRGVGRILLDHVHDAVTAAVSSRQVVIRLTVAEDNARARKVFEDAGYEMLRGESGSYPSGLPSLAMRKRLCP